MIPGRNQCHSALNEDGYRQWLHQRPKKLDFSSPAEADAPPFRNRVRYDNWCFDLGDLTLWPVGWTYKPRVLARLLVGADSFQGSLPGQLALYHCNQACLAVSWVSICRQAVSSRTAIAVHHQGIADCELSAFLGYGLSSQMSSDKPFQAEVKGFFDQRSLNVGLRNLLRLEWTVDAVMASDHLRLVNFNDL